MARKREHVRRTGQLFLQELESLILQAGIAAGFQVATEVPVEVPGWKGHGRLDCCWYRGPRRALVVAFEIDGRNVGPKHIAGCETRRGNAKKFEASGAPLKVQALYSLRGDALLGRSGEVTCRRVLSDDVRVVTDEDLMAAGGLEAIVHAALSAIPEEQFTR